MPDAAEQARRDQALAASHRDFDPRENMLLVEVFNPGYHTHLPTGSRAHSTTRSINYALDLLDTGKAENLVRAVAVLTKVISLQDSDPASRTFGIWSWYLEEPIEKMKSPDLNWADFGGTTLLQVRRDHRARLPAELAAALDEAIIRAMRCIKRRNTPPSYTNIAVLGAYVTLVGGETLNLAEFVDYGRARLKRLHDYTLENGALEEYNSPNYTMLAVRELTRLKADAIDPAARQTVEALLRIAWEEVARHFHPPTGQWAGPHSRSYGSILRGSQMADIQRATGGRAELRAEPRVEGVNRIPLDCPADLEPLFLTLSEPRTVTENFVKRFNRVGTTYLHPQFALGTVSNEDLWNQRRALLLYFGTRQKPGYMHLRFLKDDYDFSSAWITTAQRAGTVLGAVTFVTNGGDAHISLDPVKNAKIRARDLRLRLEFGGTAVDSVRITTKAGATEAQIQAGELALSFGFSVARFGELSGQLVAGGDERLRWLDVVFYHGEDREFDLAALEEAIVGFAFSVGPHGQVTAIREGAQLRMESGELSVTVAVKPGLKPVAAPVASR